MGSELASLAIFSFVFKYAKLFHTTGISSKIYILNDEKASNIIYYTCTITYKCFPYCIWHYGIFRSGIITFPSNNWLKCETKSNTRGC